MDTINRTKYIIYALTGILVLGIIGFLLYRTFVPESLERAPTPEGVRGQFRAPSGTEPSGETLEETRTLAPEISGRPEETLAQLSDFPVVSPALNKEKNMVLFYKKDGGDLFVSDLQGKEKEKISNITIVGLVEALWTNTGDRAAIFYLDQNIYKGFLHIGTSSTAALPQGVRGFSWSPDGRSLAYLLPRGEEVSLVTADSAGRSPRTIFSLPFLDWGLSWVSGDRFALGTAPSGFAEGYLFTYSRSSGIFKRIAGPLFGLTSLWSPDGSRLLLSSTNAAGKNLALSIRDADGKALFSVESQTLPEKCAWASAKELFCAVPKNPAAVSWPDDYLRGEANTSDRIVRLDLERKEIHEIFADGNFAVSSLLIAPSHLVFVNRVDGTLWSLKLK